MSEPAFPLDVDAQRALYDIAERIHALLIHPTAPVTAFETWELGDVLKICRREGIARPFNAKDAVGNGGDE